MSFQLKRREYTVQVIHVHVNGIEQTIYKYTMKRCMYSTHSEFITLVVVATIRIKSEVQFVSLELSSLRIKNTYTCAVRMNTCTCTCVLFDCN